MAYCDIEIFEHDLDFLKGGEFSKDFGHRIEVRCGVLIGLMKKRF